MISDSGTIATWAARYIDMRGDMQFSLSGMLATMANGLPYSIGAAVAYPGRQVVCVVGDGGLTMLMGEIATLVKYKLPVKVIVIKNNVLGQIKWEQMVMEGNPEFGVDLQPIDFADARAGVRRGWIHDRRPRKTRPTSCAGAGASRAGRDSGGSRSERAAAARQYHHGAEPPFRRSAVTGREEQWRDHQNDRREQD